MDKYIILTNKPNLLTELNNDGFEVIESYDFVVFDKVSATYTICKLLDDSIRVTLRDYFQGKEYVNTVRVKFYETFETVEAAFEDLEELVNTEGSSYSKLVKTEINVK